MLEALDELTVLQATVLTLRDFQDEFEVVTADNEAVLMMRPLPLSVNRGLASRHNRKMAVILTSRVFCQMLSHLFS